MDPVPEIQPLSYKKRRRTFGFLILVFLASLPALYFYANGYQFDLNEPTNFVSSTGGMYVAAERTGAEIFIDGELVRETRVFRRAFYAQNLAPKTHRVHVQKENHHTWVKELPVTPHRVTEAQAFNLLLVPKVRVVSEWQSATGSMIVRSSLLVASSTNELLATTTKATSTLTRNTEYDALMKYFGTSTKSGAKETKGVIADIIERGATATSTEASIATTTLDSSGVRLYEEGDDVYAAWVGATEGMPYYYCAEAFPRYSTSTGTVTPDERLLEEPVKVEPEPEVPAAGSEAFIHPVQTIPKDAVCHPEIRMDRKGQTIRSFYFFPGSSDHVVMALDDGIYVVEIDNRAWQNIQPLIMGDHLGLHVENGAVYVYDGALIYQVILET